MKTNKSLAVISPFISLAVLLSSGCAANVVSKNAPATAAMQQTQIPIGTSIVPTVTVAAIPSTTLPLAAPDTDAQDPTQQTQGMPVLADFTPAQLWAAYKADPLAADARYYGKTFLFKNVVIEDMATLYKPADAVAYVLNNLVYFRPDNKNFLLALKVGYVVDIQGVVLGPLQNFVLVEHCTYTIVDTTNGVTRPDWITVFE